MAYVVNPDYTYFAQSTDGKIFTDLGTTAEYVEINSNVNAVGSCLVLTFDADTIANVLEKKIKSLKVVLRASTDFSFWYYELNEKFAFNTSLSSSRYYSVDDNGDGTFYINLKYQYRWTAALENGIVIVGKGLIYTNNSDYAPYVEVDWEEPYEFSNIAPQDGATLQSNLPITFSWSITKKDPTNPPPEYNSEPMIASVFWRYEDEESPTSHRFNSVDFTSYTVPAGTFIKDKIYWHLGGSLQNYTIIDSEYAATGKEYVLYTDDTDATSSAQIISPKSSLVDPSGIVEFKWEHIVSTGTEQTAADIQLSIDGINFFDFAHVDGSQTIYASNPNTIPPGNVQWRVRTYNADNVPGNWSEPARIISYGSPAPPILSLNDIAPYLQVSWSAEGQVAYRYKLSNAENLIICRGQKFGTDKTLRLNYLLESKQYVFFLQIQNEFGLWSDWATAGFSVSNTPADPIILTAIADNEVDLSWESLFGYPSYIVKRNGVEIAYLKDSHFVDRYASGYQTYQVIGIADDRGNHTLSNSVSVNIKTKSIMIADMNRPIWQLLPLSTGSLRKNTLSASHSSTYLYYTGAALPSAEIGEAVNKTYHLNCAFSISDLNAANAFEDLLGKLVCVKEPDGERYIGVLDSMSKETVRRMYRSYSANITLVDWEEGAT